MTDLKRKQARLYSVSKTVCADHESLVLATGNQGRKETWKAAFLSEELRSILSFRAQLDVGKTTNPPPERARARQKPPNTANCRRLAEDKARGIALICADTWFGPQHKPRSPDDYLVTKEGQEIAGKCI